jgi:photosystem II stability/assembly factor-like uncharacterized protein
MNRAIAMLVTLILLTALIGCSSPLGDDDESATPSPVSPTASPTGAATPPQETEPDSSPEAEPSPEEPTPTATEATPAATGSSTAARPTPTDEPLPAGGAELLIEGEAVTQVIPGSETGRTMYAVAGEQLWRTNDGGRTWTDAGAGDIGAVVVALNEQNVLYSGDRGTCGRGFSFYEFRRSTDAGRTWEAFPEHMDIEPLIAYEAQDAAIVYGTNCGLSVSADGGTTWERVPDLNGEDVFAVATERTDPMAQIIVVAATEGGTGRLFLFDTSEPTQPLFTGALAQYWGDAAVDWTDGRIVLAHAHMVGVSDDGGATWQWTRNGLEEATFSVDPLFESLPENEMDPFRRFEVARIDPTDRERIWLGGTRGAYLSVDGGQSWERVGDDVEITGIAISTLTDRVLISSANGTRLWELDEN